MISYVKEIRESINKIMSTPIEDDSELVPPEIKGEMCKIRKLIATLGSANMKYSSLIMSDMYLDELSLKARDYVTMFLSHWNMIAAKISESNNAL
jgi:hypothetical protein